MSIKILHCADTHLGDLSGPVKDGKNARREDTLRCMRAIAESAAEEKPDMAIIAGDLFNRSRVWADTALEDIDDAINGFLIPICRASSEVVLLFGTQNHDNPKAFSVIQNTTRGIKNLHIYTGPAVETLATAAGAVQILAMPGFDKGRLRAFMPDMDAETENQNATTLVNEIIMGNAAQLDPVIPSILVAHYTVAGAEGESGQTFLAGQDVVILPQTIDAAGVTLGCFGHIHKPQRLGSNTPAFYSGSPNELTFNDEGMEHGFYYHTIEGGTVTESRFVQTPARRHHTMKLVQEEVAEFIASGSLDGIDELARDAIVRVYYDATPEQEKQINRAALQNWIMDKKNCGAFHVADFIREETEDELTLDTVSAEDTPAAALHRYLANLKDSGADFTDSDMERLEELAIPIIRQADDGREADQHTGAFIPKRIEVMNYRSYTSAAFGFEEIRMAMVNGPNGVGKSSLFMDAIADCLYEQSRDGTTGGWLRAGEKKGAITFEFEMGGYDYRVARTRTAAGKGTLALARKNRDTGEWENDGDTTIRLTQEKITKTIGMDCQTFCSIALIRQDAYGLFLDTDSDRRMEVLSTLLNLGVYGRAEEITKGKATEQRRTIAQLNDRMEVLDEQMRTREAIENEMKSCQEQMDTKTAQRTAVEGQIKAAEREETLRQELIRQADEKAQEAANKSAQAAEKDAELQKQKTDQENASALAAMAPAAAKAAETIAQARADLEPLAQDEAKLASLTDRRSTLTAAVQKAETDLASIRARMNIETTTLENREQIEAAVAEIEAVRAGREALAPKLEEYERAEKRIADLKKEQADLLAESRIRIGKLKNQIETAEKKTALLASSGCPIADEASCGFLKDAQAAKAELQTLKPQLEEMKAADKKAYEEITARLEAAKTALDSLGDPKAESTTLAARERKAAILAAHAGKLEAAAATLEQLKQQEAEKQEAIKETERERDQVCEDIVPLEKSAEKAKELREKIKAAEPTAKLQPQCAAAEATVKALEVTIDLLTKDAEKKRQEAAVAQQEATEMRARVPESTIDLEALRKLRDTMDREAQEAAKQIGSLQGKLEAIEDAKVQWEAYRDEKGKAARWLHDYETLAGAFGLDGIQYTVIRNTVPEIQARANAILSAMTGGRMAVDFKTEREQKNKKIVNSLDVWINSLSGGSRPYSSHSGGEKVKIALAVTLGLADVKAHRAGVQLGMLWIDEPPFLDGDGTDAYADALVSMANRNPEMRILAISHDPQLKARFAQNITVKAGENGSEVAMEQ